MTANDGIVLVTGARGNIGSRIVRRLAADGHPVRATARDAAGLAVPAGVATAALDLTDPATAGPALDGARTLFLYPTFGDVSGFLTAAVKADVEHVVMLSSPAAYEPVEHAGWIGRTHQAIETAVRESGLAHTILYPSWLGTNVARDWGEQIRAGEVALAHPEWQVNPIHLDDIAEVAVDLLTREQFRGLSLAVTGPESMSQREAVARVAAAIGRPLKVAELSPEAALAAKPEWFPEEAFTSLLDVAANFGGLPATVNNNVERVTGHPARPFDVWLRDAPLDGAPAR